MRLKHAQPRFTLIASTGACLFLSGQVLVFSATLVLPEELRGRLQRRRANPAHLLPDKQRGRGSKTNDSGSEPSGGKEGKERERVLKEIMALTGIRRPPAVAIVDLTPDTVVASRVLEAAIE